jgi:hypothetical protein
LAAENAPRVNDVSLTECPLPVEADISPKKANAPFDPKRP